MSAKLRLALELIGLLVLAIAIQTWGTFRDGFPSIDDQLRSDLYAIFAQVFGALLGFVITALAILLALPDTRRLRWLRQQGALSKVFACFRSAAATLLMATAISLLGMLIDRGAPPARFVVWAEAYAVTRSALIVVFSLWALNQIISLAAEDLEHSETVVPQGAAGAAVAHDALD